MQALAAFKTIVLAVYIVVYMCAAIVGWGTSDIEVELQLVVAAYAVLYFPIFNFLRRFERHELIKEHVSPVRYMLLLSGVATWGFVVTYYIQNDILAFIATIIVFFIVASITTTLIDEL